MITLGTTLMGYTVITIMQRFDGDTPDGAVILGQTPEGDNLVAEISQSQVDSTQAASSCVRTRQWPFDPDVNPAQEIMETFGYLLGFSSFGSFGLVLHDAEPPAGSSVSEKDNLEVDWARSEPMDQAQVRSLLEQLRRAASDQNLTALEKVLTDHAPEIDAALQAGDEGNGLQEQHEK